MLYLECHFFMDFIFTNILRKPIWHCLGRFHRKCFQVSGGYKMFSINDMALNLVASHRLYKWYSEHLYSHLIVSGHDTTISWNMKLLLASGFANTFKHCTFPSRSSQANRLRITQLESCFTDSVKDLYPFYQCIGSCCFIWSFMRIFLWPDR